MRVISGITCIGILVALSSAVDPSNDPSAKLYQKHCVQCHGKDGRGVASMAKILKVEPRLLDLSREEVQKGKEGDLLKSISEGKNKQPGFKAKLSEQDRKAILRYIRNLMAEDISPAK